MPIGPITPGSPVTVTPDASPTEYASVQAPTATMPVVGGDLQALTLVALNIQKYVKGLLTDLMNGVTVAPNLKTTDLDAVTASIVSALITTLNVVDIVQAPGATSDVEGDWNFDSGLVDFKIGMKLSGGVFNLTGGSIAGSANLSARLISLQGSRFIPVSFDGPDGTVTLVVTNGDRIYAPMQAANVDWLISMTSVPLDAEIEITSLLNNVPQITNPAKVITLKNGDGTSINCIIGGGSGSIEAAKLQYRGPTLKWQVAHRWFTP